MAEQERALDPEVLDGQRRPIAEGVTTDAAADPAADAAADPAADSAADPAADAAADPAADATGTAAGPTGTHAADAAAAARPPRRQLPVLLAATAVAFALDLVTKLLAVAHLADRAPVQVVPKLLDLQLTRNPGAAFGFASGATILFTVVAAAVVVFIVATARRLRSLGWAIALGLLLGGAVGNLGDRLFRDPGPLRGHVVDWIHLTHWPIFNIADTCIVVGGILAVLLSLRGRRLDGTLDRE